MDEVKVWDYVIKWGIAQNPSLPSDLDQWSDEHFLTLKNSLQNCLPLIRYFQTSNDDVCDKVRPYQKILDPILWNDIMLKLVAINKAITITSHVLPPRTNLPTTLPSRDSITDNYASEIGIIDPTIANEVMPDLGYEIEDFQYYTWRITCWSGLEKRITSPEFEAGGWNWRVLFYPFGINNSDTVSIYLGSDPKRAPAGWYSCVQFALLLWNPEDPTSYVSRTAHHRFTAKEPYLGFPRFYDLRKLFVPSENHTRPLIENDACNITAFVRIIKDPTGVLWHYFINKEIKAHERYLYLPTKIVTPEIFARHQGFDLANFNNQQYPLSDVPQFMVLKSETYGNFKDLAVKHLGYPAEQIRFWIFCNRQNRTVRPDTPIMDNFFGMTMGEINKKTVPTPSELKLFLEVAKPINGKVWFPRVDTDSPYMLVFIKYFNPDTQSLEGLCHLYIRKFDKVADIIPILCEKKDFPPHTPLKIYEEIKPYMIEEMKPNLTFQKSEIQNGDIICFQKALTEEEIQGHTTAGRIYNIPAFYDSLYMKIIVHFKPRYKDIEPNPEFELVLNRKYTYDDIAKRVAVHLSTDPFKLQFTTVNPTTDKHIVIKRTTTQIFSEMIYAPYLCPYLLYYETVNINNVELKD
ncbi:ICP0-binding domain of ubiquitin-specific protease 7-domain-containing protein [Gigaspora rosea]|uniref:ICP0-binding domain of ubiquitin-specific protease 7-domain-containing protein n=1 Tax=Gigaspora rosea TaxID=44941 RepID=A0A397VEZ4_9GLOM|nr:ICP0-binding domain of ubiquitin-specific protease 7-domain-containing protein [Gigaspora rosea]